jgi:hypothetical protein
MFRMSIFRARPVAPLSTGLLVLASSALVVEIVLTLFASPGEPTLNSVNDVLATSVMVAAGLAAALGGLVRPAGERAAWEVLGFAVLVYAAGFAYGSFLE